MPKERGELQCSRKGISSATTTTSRVPGLEALA